MVKPKKHLGQHFLTDKNIARKIVDLVGDQTATVIEIGAGTGVLTQFLIEQHLDKLRIIEIDEESVAYLNDNFPKLRETLLSKIFCKAI